MTVRRKKSIVISCLLAAIVLALTTLLARSYYRDLEKALLTRVSGRLSEIVGQKTSIGGLSFVPSGLVLNNIEISDPEGAGGGSLLLVKRLSLRMRIRPLFEGRIYFSEIAASSPALTLRRDRQGRWNISEKLMQFLRRKGTTRYRIDKFRISSGLVAAEDGIRFRLDDLDFEMDDISSEKGAKTLFKGSAKFAGMANAELRGWANLKDEPKRFALSLSSEAADLSALNDFAGKYLRDMNAEAFTLSASAEGDTEKGVVFKADLRLRAGGFASSLRRKPEIGLKATGSYDIPSGLLSVRGGDFRVEGISQGGFDVTVGDLRNRPSYEAEIRIGRLDLSSLDLMKSARLGGILSADSLILRGRFDGGTPELSGTAGLRDAFLRTAYIDLLQLNGRAIFPGGKGLFVNAEGNAKIGWVGSFRPRQPVDIAFSARAGGEGQRQKLAASVTLAPVRSGTDDKRGLHIEGLRLAIEAERMGEAAAGRLSLAIAEAGYSGRLMRDIKGSCLIGYKGGRVTAEELKVSSEEAALSAGRVIFDTREKGRYTGGVDDLDVSAPKLGAGVKDASVNLEATASGEVLTGGLNFSAGEAHFGEIRSGRVSGNLRFGKNEFHLAIPDASMGGGNLRLSARGRISPQGPFPLQAEFGAEGVDIGGFGGYFAKKTLRGRYTTSGLLKKAFFKGTFWSLADVRGDGSLEGLGITVHSDGGARKNLVKDAAVRAEVTFGGRNLEFSANASTGGISAGLHGRVEDFAGEERTAFAVLSMPETRVTDIRNAFWDIFPDRLLYAGLDGSISPDIALEYGKEGVRAYGRIGLKELMVEGEYGEFSAGPINGVVPVSYGKGSEPGRRLPVLPSFARADVEELRKYLGSGLPETGYDTITIGQFAVGFSLLKDITLRLKRGDGVLEIGRFSATMFGGRLSAVGYADMSAGPAYRFGFLLEGMSLTELCDTVGPIKGYLSGKVNGLGVFKGSATTLSEVDGMADFWTYATKTEKTVISKEFLSKLGGTSIKGRIGDRSFDRGVLGLYVQGGYVIFRELDISNRNFFGLQDLSVKVAPLNNRIALDHLFSSIVEAAQRAKKQ